MLSRDAFAPVTLGDSQRFLDLYREYPPEHSDCAFTTMVCWNSYAHYEYAEVERSIVLASTIDGNTSFRVPIGPEDDSVLSALIDLARKEGGERPLYVFGERAADWLRRFNPSITLHPEQDYFDYIYATRDLALLPGKKYLSIRRARNRFRRECQYTVEPIVPDRLDEVRTFLDQWCKWKHCEEKPVLNFEKDAVLFAIDHFSELGLSGLSITVDNQIAAMSVFEELNPGCAVVHFEKGLPECRDIYREINCQTALHLMDRYPCINRESDLGLPGLREAKMRYHPDHFVEVYSIRQEDLS